MIRHIVMWKLKAEDAETKAADAATMKSELEALVPVIDGLVSLEVHANQAYFDANWDVVLVADFPGLEDLDAYQAHPAHQAVVAIVREKVSARAAVDFEV